MYRDEIMGDYARVYREILEIADPKNSRQNFLVMQRHYLEPTIVDGVVVPLDDENGELQHYIKIHDALKEALLTGKISKEKWLPYNLPVHVFDALRG